MASEGISEHQKEKLESKDDKRSMRPGFLVADLMFLYLAPVWFSLQANVNRSLTINSGRIFELNKYMNLNLTGSVSYDSIDYWDYSNKDLSLPINGSEGILYPYSQTRETLHNFALELKPSLDFNLDK